MSERELELRQMDREQLITLIVVWENRVGDAGMILDGAIGDLVPATAADNVEEWKERAREAQAWLRGENDPVLEAA